MDNKDSIALDADKQAFITKNINEAMYALNDLKKEVLTGNAKTSMVDVVLKLSQTIVRHLYKDFGVANNLDKELEESYAICRDLNQQIIDIRKEMAGGLTGQAAGAKLYELQQIVYKWWTEEQGFSYCKFDTAVWGSGGNLVVEFSTYPNRHVFTHSKTPVSDKEKIENKLSEMKEEFQIIEDPNDEDFLLSNDYNRDLLSKKVKERFPGASVTSFESYKVYKQDTHKITKMGVVIDLNKIV